MTETQALVREIAASGLFDADDYRNRCGLHRASDEEALLHYIQQGLAQNHRPSAQFDPVWYRERYPDTVAAGVLPLLHYIRHGRSEGRQPTRPSVPTPRQTARTEAPAPQAVTGAHNASDFSDLEGQCLFVPRREAPFSEASIRGIGHMVARKRHDLRASREYDLVTDITVLIPWNQEAPEDVARSVASVARQTKARCEVIVLAPHAFSEAVIAQLQTAATGLELRCVEAPDDVSGILAHAHEAVATRLVAWLAPGARLVDDYVRIMRTSASTMPSPFVLHCATFSMRAEAPADSEDHANLASITLDALQASVLEHRGSASCSGLLHEAKQLAQLPTWPTALPLGRLPWLLKLWLAQQAHGRTIPCLLVDEGTSVDAVAFAAETALDTALIRATKGEAIADRLKATPLPALQRMVAPRVQSIVTPAPYRATVIIPSYECAQELGACVEAVRRFSPSDTDIVIVDNASGTETQSLLTQLAASDRLTVIRNSRNLGFTHAVNQGMACAAPDTDLVLLNNDAIVTPGWLDAMQAVRVTVPEAGLVVPQQVLLPDSPTMETHHPRCNPGRELDVNLSHHHGNVLRPLGEGVPGLVELRFAPFFCVLIPRNVYTALGPLDHLNGPHYRSDNLYCDAVRRILRRPVLHTSHAKVYHLLQRATAQLKATDAVLYETMFQKNDWAGIAGHGQESSAHGS
ncbi:glycosyltransferase family 2 protein [Algiphilus sp.]|uniref:glycosyltransferase family 2 protein n=1 Tax=Algiphilus sp. TaxID=1872431 RepID=UPI003B51E65A